jgi:transcriptional regulator with XRE-family HTH domain
MGKTLASRLEFLISNLGIKQSDFAQKIHFAQSYVSMVLNGSKTSPSSRFFDAVCREFNVNAEWLINGKGDTFTIPGLPTQSEDAELLVKYRLLPNSEQKIVEEIINAFLLKTMTCKTDKKKKK